MASAWHQRYRAQARQPSPATISTPGPSPRAESFASPISDDLVQTSWLNIIGEHARPEKYFGSQGSQTVELNFDWHDKRATGVSEAKPVDIKLKDGTQDVMSIQVEVMLDLKNGNLPENFPHHRQGPVEGFQLHGSEGTAKIKTAIGELDTVIVTSQRPATIASYACGLRRHWDSCRCRRSAAATAN